MTAQEADRLRESGVETMLFSNPLEGYFHTHERPPFVMNRTSNWRGYTATWEIVGNELFIVAISGFLQGQKEVGLVDLFPGKEPPILADWVNGQLRTARGECIVYVHMGYQSIYEQEETITIKDGRITDRSVTNNTKYKGYNYPF